LKTSIDMLIIMGSSPLQMQKLYPTRDDADQYLDEAWSSNIESMDANDFLYQLDSSRNYNPSGNLEKIR
jgi:homoserine O-acetyltransferase/O-succinyltransferase